MVRNLLPSLLILAVLTILHGCYYLRQGSALWDIYGKAKDIRLLLSSQNLDPETRNFLERTLRIREFGISLGLKDNDNYTTYAEIDRDYLAAVVSACRPLEFQPHLWWHPVVGSVPYQGYFDIEEARAEAKRLESQGWDVWIRGVNAFSTLGWFRDPLFHFMKGYNAGQLADLLLHEQTHATLWVSGHPDFNESLAVVVGRRGALAYLNETYGENSQELRDYRRRLDTNRKFLDLFLGLKKVLGELYARDVSRDRMLTEKARTIKEFQENLPEDLAAWKTRPINNAVLMTLSTYEDGVAKIESFFDLNGGLKPSLEILKRADFRGDPWTWLDRELARTRSP